MVNVSTKHGSLHLLLKEALYGCCFSFFFSPAEEEQSRRIFGGNFQPRAHDGNKAAGLKVTTCSYQQLSIYFDTDLNYELGPCEFESCARPQTKSKSGSLLLNGSVFTHP